MATGWPWGGHGVDEFFARVAEVAVGVAQATPSATPVTRATPLETSIIGTPRNLYADEL